MKHITIVELDTGFVVKYKNETISKEFAYSTPMEVFRKTKDLLEFADADKQSCCEETQDVTKAMNQFITDIKNKRLKQMTAPANPEQIQKDIETVQKDIETVQKDLEAKKEEQMVLPIDTQ